MMINKRLIGTVKESKKYIAGNVICQWVSLVANITMMGAVAKMLQSLFEGIADMNRRTDELSGDEERMKRTAGRNTAVTGTVILIFDLAMLFLSAVLCGFEGCLIATLALMSSFGPVVALAALGATLQNTFAAGNRVLDILDESPVVDEITGRTAVEFCGASAENVTFAYGDEVILDNFSVEISENRIIGINGRSGSGKSTLLKLFMRFWQVQRGAVNISGKNVDEINTANLRDMESFVTQETHLFHDSIRSNPEIASRGTQRKNRCSGIPPEIHHGHCGYRLFRRTRENELMQKRNAWRRNNEKDFVWSSWLYRCWSGCCWSNCSHAACISLPDDGSLLLCRKL